MGTQVFLQSTPGARGEGGIDGSGAFDGSGILVPKTRADDAAALDDSDIQILRTSVSCPSSDDALV